MEHIWGEIRWDYLGDHYTIDAWLTDDDNEEGKTIATIDMETGEIIHHDVRAKSDPYAQEIINEVIHQRLLDRVVEVIRRDIDGGDYSAVEELISFCPQENLIQSLPEEEWKQFDNLK